MTAPQSREVRFGGRRALVLTVASATAFLVLALIGAGQAARAQRIFGVLDPVFQPLIHSGKDVLRWPLNHAVQIAQAVTATTSLIALIALALSRWRGVPVVLLAAAVSLATWGQVDLLLDRIGPGAWLYGCGIGCAFVLGLWCPLSRLGGFPRLPPATAPNKVGDTTGHPVRGWEYLIVFVLIVVGLMIRAYALTELPQAFDFETAVSMVAARTLYGLHLFLQGEFLTAAPGFVHVLTEAGLYQLFGTSIYSLRLAAVLWGLLAIPLFYFLVRRLAGVAPAIVATVCFAVAPEQLFWSRTENTFFAPVAVAGLIAVHLGLSMLRRFSVASVLAAALWMPLCHYFYTPCMIMFLYPVALYGHAVIFVRHAWRRALTVVPALATGVVLWIFSLSFVVSSMNHWEWRFVHPTMVYGDTAWRTFVPATPQTSLPQVVHLQAVLITTNLAEVIAGVTHHGPRMFSHWNPREHADDNHRTLMNLGITVMFLVGCGYLAAQGHDPRAFALLLWVVLGLLPGLMSNEPSGRRIVLIFPAVYAIAGVMLGAALHLVQERTAPWLMWAMTPVVGVAVGGIVLTSLASHFLVRMGPIPFAEDIRFAKPLFDDNDAIFYDLPAGRDLALVFGNLDRFVESPPCYQRVGAKGWLDIALRPRCQFDDLAYRLVLPPERVETVQRAFSPHRITYLLEDNPSTRPHIELLRHLYPSASTREHRPPFEDYGLVALTVDIADVEALHSPSLVVGPGEENGTALRTGVLDGVALTLAQSAERATPTGRGIEVSAGVLLGHDDWYRWELDPPCADAAWTVDGRIPSTAPQPMLAGVHAFTLGLTHSQACRLPLRLRIESVRVPGAAATARERFLRPAVLSVPDAHAPALGEYAGYGEAQVFAQLADIPMEFDVDGDGRVSVLTYDRGNWAVRRFDPSGHEEAMWRPQIPPQKRPFALVVDSNGTYIVLLDDRVLMYDTAGNPVSQFQAPGTALFSDVALWSDGRMLIATPTRDSILLVTRTGEIEREVLRFTGGPGRFRAPGSVTVGTDGTVIVIQDDGTALALQSPMDQFAPVFVRSFRINFSSFPVYARGTVFDGSGVLLVPDPNPIQLVYNPVGERLLAADPARDLSSKGFGAVRKFRAARDRLYVLDEEPRRLWVVAR